MERHRGGLLGDQEGRVLLGAVTMRRNHCGFTLIELLIAVAVLGVVVAMALPNFQAWIANTKIRTTAEAILNGMQLARAEAVRRNRNVQMVLNSDSSWTVSEVATATTLQSRPVEAGAGTLTITRTPAAATRVTFNGLGRVTTNTDGSASLTQVEVDTSAVSAAQSRELRITINTGGEVRMCDPSQPASDPRSC